MTFVVFHLYHLTGKILPQGEFLSNHIMFTIQSNRKINVISAFLLLSIHPLFWFRLKYIHIEFVIHRLNAIYFALLFVNIVRLQETNSFSLEWQYPNESPESMIIPFVSRIIKNHFCSFFRFYFLVFFLFCISIFPFCAKHEKYF